MRVCSQCVTPTLLGQRKGPGRGPGVLLLNPELRGAARQSLELQSPLLVLGLAQPGQGAEVGPAEALGPGVWQWGVDQLVCPVGGQVDPMNGLLCWVSEQRERERAGGSQLESLIGGQGAHLNVCNLTWRCTNTYLLLNEQRIRVGMDKSICSMTI